MKSATTGEQLPPVVIGFVSFDVGFAFVEFDGRVVIVILPAIHAWLINTAERSVEDVYPCSHPRFVMWTAGRLPNGKNIIPMTISIEIETSKIQLRFQALCSHLEIFKALLQAFFCYAVRYVFLSINFRLLVQI